MQNIVQEKKSLYTIWANKYLQNEQIHDLFYDISNGKTLLKLLESLWKEPIGTQWNPNPSNFAEKRSNIQQALDFLTQKKGMTQRFLSTDIVHNKDRKTPILLLDSIYQLHSIDPIEFGGEKGSNALLLWCQDAVKGKNVQITDFSKSWKDGNALSVLLEKYAPSGMNISHLKEILGLSDVNEICDESINKFIASQIYHLFSNTTQTLDAPSSQEVPKKIPPKVTNNLNNQQRYASTPSLENYQKPKKAIFKLFHKKKDKKINLKIETPKFIPPNFNENLIPQDQLVELMANKKYLPYFINQRFSYIMPSRYPIQVAFVPKDSKKVEFKKDLLQSVLSRAGSRPIICVSILGSYQQGKSTSLGGITGSYGYAVGNTLKDKTKGVYIDGPYDIDYLYKRFDYPQSNENFFLKVDSLKPVVFFFDIEGYGGLLHGEEDKKSTDLFIQLCTPFMCISSVFIYLSPAAPQLHEIKTIVDTMRISTLTSVPKDLNEDSNGELKMIVAIKGVQILENRIEPYTNDEIDALVNDSLMKKEKETLKQWQGVTQLEKNGIHVVFSPLMDRSVLYGYTRTFGYFARDVISGIEVASQGHFMRGYQNCMNLFDFIISHYHDGKFSDKIKERITEEYQNTLGRVALRTLYEIRDEIAIKLDKDYEQMEKNPTMKRKDLKDYKNEYFEFGQHSMERKLDVVGDTTEVHRYYQLLCYFITEMIDKKENHFREFVNDNQVFLTEQSKEIAMKFYANSLETSKNNLLQTLKSNQYFNFDKEKTENYVSTESADFVIQLRNLQKEKNLAYFTENDIAEIYNNYKKELMSEIIIEFNNDEHLKVIEEQKEQAKIKFENIKKQKDLEEKTKLEQDEKKRKEMEVIENNKREAEIQRQKRDAKISIQNGRARIIINDKMDVQLLHAFTRCERNVVSDLKDKLEDKQYYIKTYNDIDNVSKEVKETIKNELFDKIDALIDTGIDDLKEKKGYLLEAIERVYLNEKDSLLTQERINKFVEGRTYQINEDVICTFNTARVLLTSYSYEQKREKTKDKKWFVVKFRKITIYPDGKEVPGEWIQARLEKRGLLQKFLEFIKIKDYSYVKRITQYEYSQLINLLENQQKK